MRLRRITPLVVLYLALDFANPMMPGAVQLIGGCLETVAGCQARNAQAPAPSITTVPRDLSTVVPRRDPTARAIGRVVSASPHVAPLLRSPLEPRSTLASSPDDD